jgi:hypothetical protein
MVCKRALDADTPRGQGCQSKGARKSGRKSCLGAEFRTRGPSDIKSERAGDMAHNCWNCKASSETFSQGDAANPLKRLGFLEPTPVPTLLPEVADDD